MMWLLLRTTQKVKHKRKGAFIKQLAQKFFTVIFIFCMGSVCSNSSCRKTLVSLNGLGMWCLWYKGKHVFVPFFRLIPLFNLGISLTWLGSSEVSLDGAGPEVWRNVGGESTSSLQHQRSTHGPAGHLAVCQEQNGKGGQKVCTVFYTHMI